MIEIKKGAGKFCSVTLDKYTSTRSRRYMSLNLHCDSDLVNLGMVRIKGSMPAERVENLMKKRLHEFGLKMEDIIAATTDGAGVMRSFERSSVHPLCFAHGYHLAVTNFLYARQNLFEEPEKERENNNTGSHLEFFSEEEMEEVFVFVLFAIFILHSRESELHRYTLDGKSALAWEFPFSRFMGHLSST